MSDDVTADALWMCARELARWRAWAGRESVSSVVFDEEIEAVVNEMLAKATGFGSEEAT